MDCAWSRPKESVSYPIVWCEFTAKEAKHSEREIKYWVQDLPEDRFDDAIQFLADYFVADAPISKYFGAATKKTYVEDYLRPCRWRLPQKASLVCFREGSDEIVGLSVNYVAVKNDSFGEEVAKATQTNEYKDHMAISKIMYANIDLFEKYGVDKYLGCMCLSVGPAYRGMNIGQRLLEAHKPLCNALHIHLTQSFLSSDYSNDIADKIGFKVETQYTMDEMNRIYPKIPFNQIDAKIFTVKSWNFQRVDE